MQDFTESKRKINIRQLMILFTFTFLTDMSRISANISDNTQISKGKWLSVFFSLVVSLTLVFIISEVTKRHREKSLGQIIEMVFGKAIGKMILFLYYTFLMFLIAYFVRNFSEKFIFSVFAQTEFLIFAVPVLLFAVFMARKNLESFIRFAEFVFILVLFALVFSFFIGLFKIDIKNLYPVTGSDFKLILKNSVPLTSVFSMFALVTFFGDNTVKNNDMNGKKDDGYMQTITKYLLITALISLFGTILVIGIFNAKTAANMSMPFYMIFKSIKTIGLIQSFETFFVMFWVFVDFITITYYILVMQKVKKQLFNIEKTKFFIYPSVFLILLMTFFIGKNIMETEYFYTYYLNGASLVLCCAVPVITLITGKIRRIL